LLGVTQSTNGIASKHLGSPYLSGWSSDWTFVVAFQPQNIVALHDSHANPLRKACAFLDFDEL
jgi:hypothetical protein